MVRSVAQKLSEFKIKSADERDLEKDHGYDAAAGKPLQNASIKLEIDRYSTVRMFFTKQSVRIRVSLERYIVVKVIKIGGSLCLLGWLLSRLRCISLISKTILAGATSRIKHLHLVSNNFSGIAFNTILLPGTGLQSSFYI